MTSTSDFTDIAVPLALLSGGLNIGLNLGIVGPTIPDLALLTGSSVSATTNVLVSRALSFILASVLGSFIFEKVDGYFVLTVTLVLQAVSTAFAASSTNLYVMLAVQAIANFFSTIVVTGIIFLVFRLPESRSRILTQVIFVLFNLGKTVIPFIVQPFLAPQANRTSTSSPSSTERPSDPPHGMPGDDVARYVGDGVVSTDPLVTHVSYAYGIVGLFSLVMALLFAAIVVAGGCRVAAAATDDDHKRGGKSPSANTIGSPARCAVVLTVFAVQSFVVNGIEFIDSGLMMTYLTEYLHRSKMMGLVVTSVYQGVKVVVCSLLVLIINRVHLSVILVADAVCMVIASCGMTVSVSAQSDAGFYVSVIILSIGMSNLYATLLSWLQSRYPISARTSGIFTICMGISGMAFPPLATYLLDTFDAIAYPVTVLALSVICLGLTSLTKMLFGETCWPTVHADVRTISIDEEHKPLLTEESDRSPSQPVQHKMD